MANPRVQPSSAAKRAKKVLSGPTLPKVPARASIDELTERVRKHLSAWGKADAHTRVELGHLLHRIRAKLEHGAWIDWVEAEVPFSLRTAQQFIDLYEWSRAQPLLFQRLAPLGATKLYMLQRLAVPVLESLLARPTHVVPSTGVRKSLEVMTQAELDEVLAALREASNAELAQLIQERSQARVRAVVRSVEVLIEYKEHVSRDAVEDMHDHLLAAAGELARAFELSD